MSNMKRIINQFKFKIKKKKKKGLGICDNNKYLDNIYFYLQ